MDASVVSLITVMTSETFDVLQSAVTTYWGLLISLVFLGYIAFRIKRAIGSAK